MIDHIVNKYSKLGQKDYNIRYNWSGKVIHFEMCKRLKFHHNVKWFMCKLESTLENETHGILRDFVIQTDHSIPARKTNLVLINEKKKRELIV